MAREAYISLRELFCIFLQVGCVAFGGFMALISVMADTIVEKRKLLTQDDMLDCISGIFAPRLSCHAGHEGGHLKFLIISSSRP